LLPFSMARARSLTVTYMRAHTHTYTHARTHTHMHTRMRGHTQTHIRIYTGTPDCECVLVCLHVCGSGYFRHENFNKPSWCASLKDAADKRRRQVQLLLPMLRHQVCVHVCKQARSYEQIYVYVCMCICMYMHMYACLYVCM